MRASSGSSSGWPGTRWGSEVRLLLLPLAALLLAPSGCAGAGSEPAAVSHASRTDATRAVAQAFLHRYLIENDVVGAYATHAHPDFIQHNQNMANGTAAHRAYFARLAEQEGGAPADWAHVTDMLLVDGDIFALLHHVFRGPDDTGRIFVDLWRVEDGRIAEHWDVIQQLSPDMPHANGMGCGNLETWEAAAAHEDSIAAPTCGLPDAQSDRAASLAVYKAYTDQVATGGVLPAIERWFHPDYRQHSPIIAEGKQGAIDYLQREWGRPDGPRPRLGPQRIVAQGDLILVHYMYKLEGQPEEAHVDVFRITGGLISEHWDFKQPASAQMAHDNGMW